MEVLVEGCRLSDREIRHLYPRPDRPLKLFGVDKESLMPSSQEKPLSISVVARTVNRHRWER